MKKLDLDSLKDEYIGKQFGWVTILDVFRDDNGIIKFKYRCKCGTIRCTRKNHVLSGSTNSCGCYKKSDLFSQTQRDYFINNPSAANHLSDCRKDISKNYRINMLSGSNKHILDVVHPKYIQLLLSGELQSSDIIETKCPICGEYSSHKINSVLIFSRLEFRRSRAPLCTSCVGRNLSSCKEQEVADYIYTFYGGECIRNSRNIISPLELDLYYPEKRIAIEFNGDYWHSSEFKDKDYHYNKFSLCREQNILLVSIFESFWRDSNDSIKNYLSDLFQNKVNSISMVDDLVMNNNYPRPDLFTLRLTNYAENYYVFDKYRIYTCGCSAIEI